MVLSKKMLIIQIKESPIIKIKDSEKNVSKPDVSKLVNNSA